MYKKCNGPGGRKYKEEEIYRLSLINSIYQPRHLGFDSQDCDTRRYSYFYSRRKTSGVRFTCSIPRDVPLRGMFRVTKHAVASLITDG